MGLKPWHLASLLAAAAVIALNTGCGGGAPNDENSTSTPAAERPPPTPVSVAQAPLGAYQLGDPALAALPGATADVGTLGGSIYQIEMPDTWNGQLVLYLHGCCGGDTLEIEPPPDRELLIENGWAWGASSFSSNLYFPGTAADETAALWDFFVGKYGRPNHTYVMGVSMGGAGSILAAERYADRFDGAMPLCASDGALPHVGDWFGDFFVAGAYAAGVTQAQFETTEIGELIQQTIIPTLDANPDRRSEFEALYTSLSGGARPLAQDGLLIQEATLWDEARGDIGGGTYDNQAVSYTLSDVPSVTSDQFNASAVRIPGGPLRESFYTGQELTGDIRIPVYAIHATGDAQNPLREEQSIRRRVDGAGQGDLLVQHAIQGPAHCDAGQIYPQLQELAAWVEQGTRPRGEDVLASDLSNLGAAP